MKSYPPWLTALAVFLNLSSIIFIPAVCLLNYFGWMKIRGKGSIVLLPKKTSNTNGRNGQVIRLGRFRNSGNKSRVEAVSDQPENGNCERLITNGDTSFA
jgi:hypothetical protein